jgi:hypothetical protein
MNRKLLLVSVVAFAGCSRGFDRAELPGVYSFEVDGVKQEVTIEADGKYANVLYREGRLVWSDRGEWAYEEHNGKVGVTLGKFRFGIPGHSAVSGYWFVSPEKSFSGARRLCFDLDLDRCFEAR